MRRAWLLVVLTALACMCCDVARAADSGVPGVPGAPGGSAAAPAPAQTGAPAQPPAASGAPAAPAAAATPAPTDTAATPAPVAPRTAAPTAPPKTNPPGPATGTRVTVLPGTTGKAGTSFVFQFAGFMPGGVNVTATSPNGTLRSFGSSAGLDGTGSFTLTTKATDLLGRYSVKIDGGGFSVTAVITLTAP